MSKNKLPTGPNEGGNNQSENGFDSITSPKKADISEIFQDVHKMKFYAEKIELKPGITLDIAVKILLRQKLEGKNCFIDFNGVKIYSADTNSVDDAYLQYTGMTKAENEERSRKQREERRLYEEEREQREEKEKGYVNKIDKSREGLEEVKITKENVVAGLKFIAEHPRMEYNQLIDELIALGCNFTLDDIRKQLTEEIEIDSGMKSGNLLCGANLIANLMKSELGRGYANSFLRIDNDTSVYAFIRKVTGDKSYTKEYVDSLIKKERGTENL